MAFNFYHLLVAGPLVDVILITMDYLDPHDLLHLLQAIPYLTRILTSRHLRAQDENGDTILHLIVERGIEDMIMIKPLARIIPGNSIANNAKLTPLHQAVINVNEKMTRFLVDAGSYVSAPGPDGNTALHYACRSKYPSASDHIYKQGRLAILRILIDSGADLNVTGFLGMTPIFFTNYCHVHECIPPLIDAGANLDIPNRADQTILVKAASTNDVEVIRLLLDAGMDVSGRGYKSLTPLMAAAGYYGESDEVFDLLLEKGADPLMTKDGTSALHCAARRVNARRVRLLLDAGADVFANDEGKTPSDLAFKGAKKSTYVHYVDSTTRINMLEYEDPTTVVNMLEEAQYAQSWILWQSTISLETPQ